MASEKVCDVCGKRDIDTAEVIKRLDVGYANGAVQSIEKSHLCGECSYNLELFLTEIGGDYADAETEA
jgi:hypothetical protein